MHHLSPTELAQWLADSSREQPLLLDVREPWEFATCQIAGSQLIPMSSIPARQEELDPGLPVVCICHHGARSMQVANFLKARGFKHVANVAGGINAWSSELDPSVPRY